MQSQRDYDLEGQLISEEYVILDSLSNPSLVQISLKRENTLSFFNHNATQSNLRQKKAY